MALDLTYGLGGLKPGTPNHINVRRDHPDLPAENIVRAVERDDEPDPQPDPPAVPQDVQDVVARIRNAEATDEDWDRLARAVAAAEAGTGGVEG